MCSPCFVQIGNHDINLALVTHVRHSLVENATGYYIEAFIHFSGDPTPLRLRDQEAELFLKILGDPEYVIPADNEPPS